MSLVADHWHELVTAALLGTDRRDPPDPPPGPLADAVADCAAPTPSGRMLADVAACTAVRRAGLRPHPPATPLAPAGRGRPALGESGGRPPLAIDRRPVAGTGGRMARRRRSTRPAPPRRRPGWTPSSPRRRRHAVVAGHAPRRPVGHVARRASAGSGAPSRTDSPNRDRRATGAGGSTRPVAPPHR